MDKDRRYDDIHTITLSYTFYEAKTERAKTLLGGDTRQRNWKRGLNQWPTPHGAPKHPYHLVDPEPVAGARRARRVHARHGRRARHASRHARQGRREHRQRGQLVGRRSRLPGDLRRHVLVVARRHRRIAHSTTRRRPARPALRHDPVHRLGGDVLRRLLLGLLRRGDLSRVARDAGAHRGQRRHVAAQGRARHRAVRPAVHEHADPAALGHHGDLGAPFDPRGQASATRCAAWC